MESALRAARPLFYTACGQRVDMAATRWVEKMLLDAPWPTSDNAATYERKRMHRTGLMAAMIAGVALGGCGGLGKPFSDMLGNSMLGKSPTAASFVGEANPLTIDIPVAAPTSEQPVTLGAAVDRTRVVPGQSILLVVRCKTADPWYIYAAEGKDDIGVPTRLELQLPAGMTQQAAWQLPAAKPKQTPLGQVGTYANDFRFLVPLLVSPQATPGKREVQCVFHFQACSDSTCLSPASHKLVIPLTVEPGKT